MSVRSLTGPRLPPRQGAATHLVVLLHGYGADGNDLIGLAPALQKAMPTAAFVAPNAPERCPGAGYQWFALSRIDPHELAQGVGAAAPTLDAFLDAERSRLDLAGDRLALIGFSQGTMMALHVGLRRQAMPAAIVGFSGVLVSPEQLPKSENAKPPVLLTHGDADTLIPAIATIEAANALGGAGLLVRWHFSQGIAHGIGPDAIALAADFLAASFAGRLNPRETPVSCAWPRR
jgi:phospholipase/carboxylesterase